MGLGCNDSSKSSALTAQNLYHNVPGGKLNRGLSVVDTLEILKGSPLTDDEYFQAALLGWCIELVSVSEACCRRHCVP